MLILSRRIGEQLLVGDNQEISIRICGITANQVKLAIDAPPEVLILREELKLQHTKIADLKRKMKKRTS